jgi:hypothetical protein
VKGCRCLRCVLWQARTEELAVYFWTENSNGKGGLQGTDPILLGEDLFLEPVVLFLEDSLIS